MASSLPLTKRKKCGLHIERLFSAYWHRLATKNGIECLGWFYEHWRWVIVSVDRRGGGVGESLPTNGRLRILTPKCLRQIAGLRQCTPRRITLHRLFARACPTGGDVGRVLVGIVTLSSSCSAGLQQFSSVDTVTRIVGSVGSFSIHLTRNSRALISRVYDGVRDLRGRVSPGIQCPGPFSFTAGCYYGRGRSSFPVCSDFITGIVAHCRQARTFLPTNSILHGE